ncbi:hypothetical protein HMI54_011887 [Coelomomyces lativittatus]|nr:hypothetical protein HMI56_000022 [Coelomomyces lativittatus]KAJ1515682.1 hypothetical protein HMI54_011887 [Coelomomyces lativittatus]KAJ1517573.1 hypothetical protein HMI55_006650 [Coelomomyces lativittatus]
MQCTKPTVALLSNYEVFHHLTSFTPLSSQPSSTTATLPHKPTSSSTHPSSLHDVEPSLSSTTPPSTYVHPLLSHVKTSLTQFTDLQPTWTPTQVQVCLTRFKSFPLTKLEKLHILNTRPNNLVGLYACIEEADARFTNDMLLDMLSVLDTYLPLPTTMTSTLSDALPQEEGTEEKDWVMET